MASNPFSEKRHRRAFEFSGQATGFESLSGQRLCFGDAAEREKNRLDGLRVVAAYLDSPEAMSGKRRAASEGGGKDGGTKRAVGCRTRRESASAAVDCNRDHFVEAGSHLCGHGG